MKYILSLTLAVFFTVPSLAQAAPIPQKNPVFPVKSFVEAEARRIESTPTLGLYLLTFSLTATGQDVYLPTRTQRTPTALHLNQRGRESGVTYSIEESDAGRHPGGVAGAFLWSEADTENGYFLIPEGTTEEITLVVAYNNVGGEKDHYRARLDGLTYSLNEDSNTAIPEVNGFEQYKTKEVELEG